LLMVLLLLMKLRLLHSMLGGGDKEFYDLVNVLFVKKWFCMSVGSLIKILVPDFI